MKIFTSTLEPEVQMKKVVKVKTAVCLFVCLNRCLSGGRIEGIPSIRNFLSCHGNAPFQVNPEQTFLLTRLVLS